MISVIVPTYNRAKVIHKSIDSILKQSYQDFEIIIVDDGSEDDTKNVIEKYNDSRIRYIINNSNIHGPSVARNIGISNSTGDYIAFNDSDDEWHSDKLEKQLDFLKKEDVDVCFCQMRKNFASGREDYIPTQTFTGDQCNVERILKGSFTGTPALFGKAECFKNIGFDEKITCNEDWELVIRLIDAYKVKYLNENLVEVTITEKSVSSDMSNALKAMSYLYRKHKKLYDRNPESLKKLKKSIKYTNILNNENKALNEKKGIIKCICFLYWRLCRYFYAFGLIISDRI